jgi:hypothetical protein
MFVTRSRFKEAEARAEYAEGRLRAQIQKYNRLVDEWNSLAHRFNALKASSKKRLSGLVCGISQLVVYSNSGLFCGKGGR